MQKFYIVRRGNVLCRLDEERMLMPSSEKAPASLFDDYDQARNAVRRTANALKKRPAKKPAPKPFQIVPVVAVNWTQI